MKAVVVLGFFFYNFIHLFIFGCPGPLVVLSLCCCTWAFSRWDERGLLMLAVHKILIEATSLAVEHRL